ncbi:MAG: hypothetical protein UT63_C0005G0005 [Candidatus Gottesmanbacteria bacterium GW2011_GWC2_39_8]|uniref:Uncharacterized protein n=1 Tax=Candidatus Gottesmanbacteria bacterium GW2011_GWC2_39_8 TaxID=1618450 RepID=A0A0G0QA14_9BACT|nr:MAG: hypothetical protein UT63_C0005G0005 [Candidatus Gottesmanbacteria bacterium GW2011_GWC2_39_8]
MRKRRRNRFLLLTTVLFGGLFFSFVYFFSPETSLHISIFYTLLASFLISFLMIFTGKIFAFLFTGTAISFLLLSQMNMINFVSVSIITIFLFTLFSAVKDR